MRPLTVPTMKVRAIATGLLLMLCGELHAVDLGRIGPTTGIGEQDFLRFIQERLEAKQRSGELARLEEQAVKRSTASIRNPQPVTGLRATEVSRTFYFDPTYVAPQNIVDSEGRLLYPAGTRKNPLEVVSLSKHLLFFDARDQRQVERARGLIAFYNGKVKPILVGGSYIELMGRWQTEVFYDQNGSLVRRLGIRQVPAFVSQEGMRLRIDEMTL
ncbi:MAG: type-F conjugative transfer system protein TraW [Fimbriimonadaceae bacterium]|nr:type-F conjugative transfer system protein TraW [Fimbriimonadaceae bacterium]